MSAIRLQSRNTALTIVAAAYFVCCSATAGEAFALTLADVTSRARLSVVPASQIAIPEPVLRNNEQLLAAQTVSRVLAEIRDANSHGLNERDYGIATLAMLHHALFERQLSADEIRYANDFARRALLGYVLDLTSGRSRASQSNIQGARRQLETAIANQTIDDLIDSLIPQHPDYKKLRAGLVQLELQRDDGGWLAVGAGPTLEMGAVDMRVTRLRQRLGVDADEKDATIYDESLRAAVLHYQLKHGLEADGRAGKRTILHLDRDLGARIAQLKLNLERWRETPLPAVGSFVHVNVPSFRLQYIRSDEDDLSMRIIVGDKETPTPIFTDTIEYLVFSPYWNVPRSIAVNELLPEIARDPAYLERGNYEIVGANGGIVSPGTIDLAQATAANFPFRLRQKPGVDNSLGLVKFIFPNDYSVYLHDTPADSLFQRATRALSHGCVRVEYPARLAAAMLADNPGWSKDRVQTAMSGKLPDYVVLSVPEPVHITYFTVIATEDGGISFFEDVYGYDTEPRALLASSRLAPFPDYPDVQMAVTTMMQ